MMTHYALHVPTVTAKLRLQFGCLQERPVRGLFNNVVSTAGFHWNFVNVIIMQDL
jgi:hypothetical protein